MKYFLGMEVARSNRGTVLSQRKYALDLLREIGMSECKPVDAPTGPNKKFEGEKNKPVDAGRYQRLMRKLIYLSHTKPDIAFAVSLVSQFMHSPQQNTWRLLTESLRYIKGTPGKGLYFGKTDQRGIEAHTDADWARSVTYRRSTISYLIFVWDNLVT